MVNYKKTPTSFIRALFLAILLVFTAIPSLPAVSSSVCAAGLLSSFEALKNDPDNQIFLGRLYAAEAGATETNLKSFLHDLDSKVRAGGALTGDNIDSQMFAALNEVILWGKHETICDALLQAFPEEITYTLSHKKLHPSLEPLRNAVRASMLEIAPPGGTPDGGGSPGATEGNAKEEDQNADLPEPGQDENGTAPPVSINFVFTDLKGHWAQEKVERLAAAGLVAGVGANSFEPQRPINRAEFTSLLVRALVLPTGGQLHGRFEDVAADTWYFVSVNAAAEAGLVSGVSARQFEPLQPITREQLAVMITAALKAQGRAIEEGSIDLSLTIFQDRQHISPWAQKGVAAAVCTGMLQGRPGGIFEPRAHATRAEAAVLLYNFINMQQ